MMRLDDLTAIDVHTHVNTSRSGRTYDQDEGALKARFGIDRYPSLEEMIDFYRARKIAFVAFMVDIANQRHGPSPVSNEEIAGIALGAKDIMIPFGSIDPARGPEGVRMMRRLVEEFGVRGFKFHPSMQEFYPNDHRVYPFYEVLAEHRLPALFHTGQTGIGWNTPGGGGVRLKYSRPVYLDDVAVDFPDMPIIMAHPSVPWQEEALSIAGHKAQVYIDLSGWSPKYFPEQLVSQAKTILKDKVLFGSDYPVFSPDRWFEDFKNLGFSPETERKILKHNAAKLLGISR